MRYAVDITRNIFYIDHADESDVVLASLPYNMVAMGLMFAVFLSVGTVIFVRSERNR